MRKMTKAEWDDLRYPVEIQSLAPDEGGGWIAWIPLLGRGMFMADGETPQEALDELEALRRAQYEAVVRSGRPIPLPDDATARPTASGKWLMRTSPRFHAELKEAAAAEGVSFNAYCEAALLKGHLMGAAAQSMSALAEGLVGRTREKREATPRGKAA